MKYIKNYKVFESDYNHSDEEIRLECEDILQGLVDDDFKVIVDFNYINPAKTGSMIDVSIRKSSNFKFEDILDEYNHILGYLSEYGYEPARRRGKCTPDNTQPVKVSHMNPSTFIPEISYRVSFDFIKNNNN